MTVVGAYPQATETTFGDVVVVVEEIFVVEVLVVEDFVVVDEVFEVEVVVLWDVVVEEAVVEVDEDEPQTRVPAAMEARLPPTIISSLGRS